MRSAYRSKRGRETIRDWCRWKLEHWLVPNERRTLHTSAGPTHVTVTGTDAPTVVLLPGTNFNTATSLPLLDVLTRRWPTVALDLPGQPGLSDEHRPRRNRLTWYGNWLTDALDKLGCDQVTVVGHSLGGAVALASDSPRIAARLLIAPAGITRLAVPTTVLRATLPWLTRPTTTRSARLLRLMHATGHTPAPDLTTWMTLIARHCRTTLAPPPLPAALLQQRRDTPHLIAVGDQDVFLPPKRLRPATAELLGADLHVLKHTGHLAPHEHPDQITALIEELRPDNPST
ncbi:MAG: alpha/beta fold hydrolase [Micromonosporaceae bacterium]